MTQQQTNAIDAANHTYCEDTQLINLNGAPIWVADIDAAARRAGVPEALALAELHRAFTSSPCDPEYKKTVALLTRRMSRA